MASFVVTSPSGEKFRISAPDGATEAQVMTYARSQFSKQPKRDLKAENPAEYDTASPEYQAKYGNKPFNPAAAVPEALMQAGSAFGGAVASGYAGLGALGAKALGADVSPGDVVNNVQSAMTYQPRTDEGRVASDVLGYVPAKLGQLAEAGGDALLRTPMTPSPYVPAQYAGTGAGSGAATIGNLMVQGAPAALAGSIFRGRGTATSSRSVGADTGRPTPAKAPDAPGKAGLGGVPPTIEELAAQSKAAYKRASDAGVEINPGSFSNLRNRVNVALKNEGLDKTLHPQTTAALKRINESKGAISLDQLETLRKIANDARGGINKADGRMAKKIVDELDNYTESLSRKDLTSGDPAGMAALKEARSLYARKSKAEEIARLVKRAEDSAPNFSASGYENALRIQFKQLAMNDKKMRRFSPEEQAAIRKVARGGPMENAMRMLGKFAPTGVVSGMAAALVSTVPGGIALPAAGIGARYAATRMTKANALKAEEVMRRGPKKKPTNAMLELERQGL
jgi:hypothetical protein